jgi:DNA-binding NtrC family response regulator
MAKAVMVISPQKSLRYSIETLLAQGGNIVCPGIDDLGGFRHALNASDTVPNVILLDYWLSRSQTQSFVKGLKQQGFVVIIMGTMFLGRDIAAAEGVGFIEKPFSKNELLKAVSQARP